MKNKQAIFIGIALLLINSLVCLGVEVKDSNDFLGKYEGEVLPDANGFNYIGNAPVDFYNFVDNGIFSHDTDSYPGSQTSTWRLHWNASFALGYTVEIRLKIISSPDSGLDVNRGYWLSAGIEGTDRGVILSFLDDKVMHRAGLVSDEMVIFGDNTDDYHVYRLIVAPGGATFDVYRDNILVVDDRAVWIAWGPLDFGDPTGGVTCQDVSVNIDYVRWDTSGAYLPVLSADPGVCGGTGTVYNLSDLNQDCYVDLKDFSIFANDWFGCTDPANLDCN